MVSSPNNAYYLITLRPRQNGRRFADDTFKRIFFNENIRISITISLKFVPKGPIKNYQALVQIMAWCRSGNKPFSGRWDVKKLSWRDLFVQRELLGVHIASLLHLFRPNPKWPPTVKRKRHILGVHGPILIILVSIVGSSGCLSWLNLLLKWLFVKIIVKRSFSRSNFKKMSVQKAFRCLIQDLNGLICKLYTFIQC